MRGSSARLMVAGAVGVLLSLATLTPVAAQEESPAATESGITTVVAGLTNPRGFAWAPDGTLYLALAGHGGDTHIADFPGFTVDIGLSSSIATIADGCATPVVKGLVSLLWEEAGWIWGAMDVEFLGEDAYALLSGAGPSNFSPSSFSGVFRLNDDGTMTLVADITTWLPQNPPAFVPPDYGSDGSLFDLEPAGDALLLSEAVGGQLIRVTPDGDIAMVADLSEGHLVPTGIAVDAEGNAFVGHETAAPYGDGASKVVKVAPDGTVSDAWTGLTVVTDVELGPDGVLYAAEMATGFAEGVPDMPPGTGRIVRQTGPDTSRAGRDRAAVSGPHRVRRGRTARDRGASVRPGCRHRTGRPRLGRSGAGARVVCGVRAGAGRLLGASRRCRSDDLGLRVRPSLGRGLRRHDGHVDEPGRHAAHGDRWRRVLRQWCARRGRHVQPYLRHGRHVHLCLQLPPQHDRDHHGRVTPRGSLRARIRPYEACNVARGMDPSLASARSLR